MDYLLRPLLKAFFSFCFLLIFSFPVLGNSLEILKLNPRLFQFQKTAFEKHQSSGILQEYLFKEMDNFPGQYGLHLSNLIHYLKVESEKKDVTLTETLGHRVFAKDGVRIKGDNLLVLQGFFLIDSLEDYQKKQDVLARYVEAARSTQSTPWAKLLLAVLELRSKALGIDLGLRDKEVSTLLSKTSAGKNTDAMFHYSLGQFYLQTLKNSNPYRRLRLITLEFERSRTKDPRNRGLFTHLTSLYIEVHEEMQARGIPEPFEFEELVYRRIILIDPKNPWAHNNLAYLYCQNHVELKDALREARIANHLEKDNPYLLDTLGWALYKNKALKEAVRVLKKSISLDDSIPDPHFHLATTYYDLKEFEKSIEHFRRCIELDPNSSLAKNNLAYLYAEMDQNIDEGIELAKKALEGNEKNSAYLDTLGWLYYRKGKYEDALEYLKKAVALSPDSAESQYHLGQVYLKLNQPESTTEHIQKSIGLQPGLESNEENLSYAILLQTIQEAKNKYLKMPGVSKTRKAMKIYYNQLIHLAQSMGDTAMIKKFAHELESFPSTESTTTADLSSVNDSTKEEDSSSISLSSFFPKEADFYLNLGKGALEFLTRRILSSGEFQVHLQGQNLMNLIENYLPHQVGVFVGSTEPEARTQVYAVLELGKDRAVSFARNMEKFSQDSIVLPWLSQGLILEPLHSGIYRLMGGQFNAFLTVKDRFLIVSNSLLTVRKMPYPNAQSLLSNASLKSTMASPPVSSFDAVLYSGNLPGIESFFEGKYAKILLKDWAESKELFQKIQNYVSLLHLGKNDFEEYEVLSLKSPSDLEPIRELLEKKTSSIRESFKKEKGIELSSEVTIRNGAIAVHTKVSNLEHFIEHFMHYLDAHRNQLMNKNKKKGESDE